MAINGISDYFQSTGALVTAGHTSTISFGPAVRGPGPLMLPHFEAALHRGEFWFDLIPLYWNPVPPDPRTGCCAVGIVRLERGGRILKALRVSNNNGAVFRAVLRRPGWYTVALRAHRMAMPAGVRQATLSTRVELDWRFAAQARDLTDTFIGVPVSVTVFRPGGLDLHNDAKTGTMTPVHLTIFRGRPGPRYRISSVRLLVSYNGGTWLSVPLRGAGSSWLARVRAVAPGFISLRSIVTDVRGDRSVETITNAYGIS